jgi:hypothetical protein
MTDDNPREVPATVDGGQPLSYIYVHCRGRMYCLVEGQPWPRQLDKYEHVVIIPDRA